METVRVRIAVAVTPAGASGTLLVGRRGDTEARNYLLDIVREPGTVVHFVDADLPKPPAPVTVEGKVTPCQA